MSLKIAAILSFTAVVSSPAASLVLATSSSSDEQTESTTKPLHERVVPIASAVSRIVAVIGTTKLAQESVVSGS